MPDACFTCGSNDHFDSLAPRERVATDEYWRVAHAFGTPLPGWLVLVPRRHVTTIAELTDAEAVTLGLWQVRLSRALQEITGCAKTYVAQFAEADGFSHVHFHVVPRMAELATGLHGPRIFELLQRPEADCLTDAERDDVALRLRRCLDPTD